MNVLRWPYGPFQGHFYYYGDGGPDCFGTYQRPQLEVVTIEENPNGPGYNQLSGYGFIDNTALGTGASGYNYTSNTVGDYVKAAAGLQPSGEPMYSVTGALFTVTGAVVILGGIGYLAYKGYKGMKK